MDISVDTVCQFITDHGGKVKNTVLVSHFKKVLNDPATKDIARQKFKECVNAVAVVKNENGEKYVQLKKKFRNANSSLTDSPSNNQPQSPLDGSQEQPKVNESIESQNASFTATDTLPYIEASDDGKSTRYSEPKPNEDIKQPSPSRKHSKDRSPQHKRSPAKTQVQEPVEDSSSKKKSKPVQQHVAEPEKPQFAEEETHFKYDANRKSSKDHQNDSIGTDRVAAAKASLQPPVADSAGFAVPNAAPLRKKKKENIPPSPNTEQRWTSVDRVKTSLMNISTTDNRMNRMRPTSVVQGSYAGGVERARQNFQGKQKTNEDSASLAPSEKSYDSKGEEIDDEYDRNIPSIALDLNEKSWIIRCAQGNLVEMRILLDLDSTLVEKRDFIMGYHALHWAAKKGNIEMMEMLLDQKIDINCRTNGGYTALHLAAMGGHKEIISRLMDCGADVHIRDYSGHKPIHYWKSMSGPLNSKVIPYDHTVPMWKRNCFAGTNFAAKIPQDIYDRLSGKFVDRKLSSISVESADAAEYVKRGARLSNAGATDRKGSFDSNTAKGKKVTRKETKIKVKRKGTFLRSKHSEPPETPPPEPVPAPVFPHPYTHKPPASSAMMWKPVGPKS